MCSLSSAATCRAERGGIERHELRRPREPHVARFAEKLKYDIVRQRQYWRFADSGGFVPGGHGLRHSH